jgi:hypothetical protein
MLSFAIGAFAFGYFGYQRKEQYELQKLIPESMNFCDLDSASGTQKFRGVMSEKGFIVFHLDETTAKNIREYRSGCEDFFLLSDGTIVLYWLRINF